MNLTVGETDLPVHLPGPLTQPGESHLCVAQGELHIIVELAALRIPAPENELPPHLRSSRRETHGFQLRKPRQRVADVHIGNRCRDGPLAGFPIRLPLQLQGPKSPLRPSRRQRERGARRLRVPKPEVHALDHGFDARARFIHKGEPAPLHHDIAAEARGLLRLSRKQVGDAELAVGAASQGQLRRDQLDLAHLRQPRKQRQPGSLTPHPRRHPRHRQQRGSVRILHHYFLQHHPAGEGDPGATDGDLSIELARELTLHRAADVLGKRARPQENRQREEGQEQHSQIWQQSR